MKSIESGYNEYAFNYFAAQVMKNAYLQDNTLDKEHYLKLISRANKSLFSDYTIRSITELSKNYILNYNMTELIERRVNNYKYLLNNIKKYSFLKPVPLSKEGVVPFGMVILSEYRDELLKFLIENNVYCNIHWNIPDECKNADVISKNISELILTIPCDQRYSQEEMDYIIKTLDSFRI